MSGMKIQHQESRTLKHQEQKMTLVITPHTMIAELQRIFLGEYPYLNLRFFKLQQQGEGLSTIKKFCDPASNLGNEFLLKKKGELVISDSMTVQELENMFFEAFGIHVQVFRRAANLWLEITLTSGWTLRQQNNHGQEISTTIY